VRDLAGRGHLAHPELVEDLAGLGVPPLVELGGLASRQHGQGLDRELRTEGHHLERGDQRVAPEQGAEPRDAGGDVPLGAAGGLVDQQAQVRHGSRDGHVEELVVRVDLGRAALPGVVRAARFGVVDPGRLGEQLHRPVAGVGRVARRGPDQPAQLAALPGSERPGPVEPQPATGILPVVARGDRLHRRRGLAEPQVGRSAAPVEPVVAERGSRREDRRRQERAALVALPAAHFEDVGPVDAQLELDVDRLRALRVIDDGQPLLEPAQRQRPVAPDPELAPGQVVERVDLVLDVPVDARVGQLDRAPIVAAGRTLQEHRTNAADADLRARQQPGIAVVESQPARVDVDVAERVGEQEQVAVLDGLDRPEVCRAGDRHDPRLEPADRGRVDVVGQWRLRVLGADHGVSRPRWCR
jgi:hypothetical protein